MATKTELPFPQTQAQMTTYMQKKATGEYVFENGKWYKVTGTITPPATTTTTTDQQKAALEAQMTEVQSKISALQDIYDRAVSAGKTTVDVPSYLTIGTTAGTTGTTGGKHPSNAQAIDLSGFSSEAMREDYAKSYKNQGYNTEIQGSTLWIWKGTTLSTVTDQRSALEAQMKATEDLIADLQEQIAEKTKEKEKKDLEEQIAETEARIKDLQEQIAERQKEPEEEPEEEIDLMQELIDLIDERWGEKPDYEPFVWTDADTAAVKKEFDELYGPYYGAQIATAKRGARESIEEIARTEALGLKREARNLEEAMTESRSSMAARGLAFSGIRQKEEEKIKEVSEEEMERIRDVAGRGRQGQLASLESLIGTSGTQALYPGYQLAPEYQGVIPGYTGIPGSIPTEKEFAYQQEMARREAEARSKYLSDILTQEQYSL